MTNLIENHNGIAALADITPVWSNGSLVWKLPPGNANGCFDLRNRGQVLPFEITCWPKPQNRRFRLTTGGGNGPQKLKGAEAHEKFVWKVANLECDEFIALARRWQAEAVADDGCRDLYPAKWQAVKEAITRWQQKHTAPNSHARMALADLSSSHEYVREHQSDQTTRKAYIAQLATERLPESQRNKLSKWERIWQLEREQAELIAAEEQGC